MRVCVCVCVHVCVEQTSEGMKREEGARGENGEEGRERGEEGEKERFYCHFFP